MWLPSELKCRFVNDTEGRIFRSVVLELACSFASLSSVDNIGMCENDDIVMLTLFPRDLPEEQKNHKLGGLCGRFVCKHGCRMISTVVAKRR